jgi:hypothetical protein
MVSTLERARDGRPPQRFPARCTPAAHRKPGHLKFNPIQFDSCGQTVLIFLPMVLLTVLRCDVAFQNVGKFYNI